MSAHRHTSGRGPEGRRGRALARIAHVENRRGPYTRQQIAQAVEVRRAQLARIALRAPPAADDDLWVPIGPTVVLNGQAGGNPRVAGRTNDIWVSSDGARVYAATANGGVWFSPDHGDTWQPLGGWAVTASPPPQSAPSFVLVCGCLYVKFGATAVDDEVLVGTGELKPRASAIPSNRNGGIGILRKVGPAAAGAFDQVWDIEGKNLADLGLFRLAVNPVSDTMFVAATSGGLWTRSGAPADAWTQVAVPPFDGAHGRTLICTDVAWTPAGSGVGIRLWVAVIDRTGAASGLYLSINGLTGPFNPVILPGALPKKRLTIAVAPSNPSVVYVLGEGNKVWRLDGAGPTVTTVSRIPPNLLGGQDSYNQAIAVHPTRPERIVLGGATEQVDGEWSASLYLASVTGAPPNYQFGYTTGAGTATNDDSFIGHGVHPDVHFARFVTVGATTELWIGCDGGLFRSQKGDADNRVVKRSFVARNSGIASLQSGYIATHPQVEGYSLLGTQDCGTLERLGDTVWGVRFMGDGGGVAFNPLAPTRVIYQYTNSSWSDEGATGSTYTNPVLRTNGNSTVANGATATEAQEDGFASFYSGCDTVVVPAAGAATAFVRVAFGTHRVWFSTDWGTTWHTLPSFGDPMAVAAQNPNTDSIAMTGGAPDISRGQVIACRWITPARLLVLCTRMVMQYDFIADAAAPGGFRITPTELTRQATHKKEDPQPANAIASPGQVLPAVGLWSDLAVHLPEHGTHGSFYVATTGDPATPAMDTLWWFDGTDRWYATNLRNDAQHGIHAPAYAVVVDPDDKNIVYVGTAVGVWKGSLTIGGPRWDWNLLCNGLPEASAQDLTVVKIGAVKLLRAAVESRGVWDLNLSGPAHAQTFVRVHDHDTRRAPAVLTNPKSAVSLSWHASPDIRVRPVQGSRPPNPIHLPWTDDTRDPYGLWVLQTALRTKPQGRTCVANGRWTPMFSGILRDVTGSNRVTQAIWNANVGSGGSFPNAYATPWDGVGPTEGDLYELIRDLAPPVASPASIGVRPVTVNVDVLVHHRHLRAIDAGRVKITLLRRTVTGTNSAQWAVLGGAFAPIVQSFLINGGATPALPDGWTFADTDPAQVVRNPYAAVDARLPRSATFRVDLHTGLAATARVLLLAVVHSDVDQVVLPNTTLQALVLGTRFVGFRSLEIV